MKIYRSKEIVIFTILLVLCIMGSAAANNISQTDLSSPHFKSAPNVGNIKTTTQSIQTPTKKVGHEKVAINHRKQVTNSSSGCCSVLLHVKSGYDVFSFRRDSTYAANLYFQQSNWYGKDTLKEFKTANGYFFHTIIAKDGWIVSTGGPDVPYLNRQLEDLAGRTSASGRITSDTLYSAKRILWSLGMGHFLLKAPNDDVALVTYNGGTISKLFKMTEGQYVSVPNSPSCYRNGYASTSNPVASAINLAITDRWGVNRRNIITYQITNDQDLINYMTSIKVYASRTRMADNIYFGGGIIGGYSLPKAPNNRYLGRVILRNNDSLPQGLFGGIYSLRK